MDLHFLHSHKLFAQAEYIFTESSTDKHPSVSISVHRWFNCVLRLG